LPAVWRSGATARPDVLRLAVQHVRAGTPVARGRAHQRGDRRVGHRAVQGHPGLVPVAPAGRLDGHRHRVGRRRADRDAGDRAGLQRARAAGRTGLGNRYAGLAGPDPGPYLQDALENTAAHAKVKAAGWPTALWAVRTPATGRSAYVGEAKGVWLYAIAWPDSAAYLFAEDLVLHDLTEWVPAELVYGAPSPYLHGAA